LDGLDETGYFQLPEEAVELLRKEGYLTTEDEEVLLFADDMDVALINKKSRSCSPFMVRSFLTLDPHGTQRHRTSSRLSD
jgi:hypothetical protein